MYIYISLCIYFCLHSLYSIIYIYNYYIHNSTYTYIYIHIIFFYIPEDQHGTFEAVGHDAQVPKRAHDAVLHRGSPDRATEAWRFHHGDTMGD